MKGWRQDTGQETGHIRATRPGQGRWECSEEGRAGGRACGGRWEGCDHYWLGTLEGLEATST